MKIFEDSYYTIQKKNNKIAITGNGFLEPVNDSDIFVFINGWLYHTELDDINDINFISLFDNCSLLEKLGGHYSLTVVHDNKIFSHRTYPLASNLFYSEGLNYYIISNSIMDIYNLSEDKSLNFEFISGYAHLSYAEQLNWYSEKNSTVFKNVNVIKLGEKVIFNDEVKSIWDTMSLFKKSLKNTTVGNKNDRYLEFVNVFNTSIKNSLRRKTALLRFTGGKDSRCILSSILYNKLTENVDLNYGFTDISHIDPDTKDGEEEKAIVIELSKKYNIPISVGENIYHKNIIPYSNTHYTVKPIYELLKHLKDKDFQNTKSNMDIPDKYPVLNVTRAGNRHAQRYYDFNLNGAGGEYWVGIKASWEQGEHFPSDFYNILNRGGFGCSPSDSPWHNSIWEDYLRSYHSKYLTGVDTCDKSIYNSVYITTSFIGWYGDLIASVNPKNLYFPFANTLLFNRFYNLSTPDRRHDEIVYHIYKHNQPEFINIPFYGQSRLKTWNTNILKDAPDLNCKKYVWNSSQKFVNYRNEIPDFNKSLLEEAGQYRELRLKIVSDLIRLVPQKNYDDFVKCVGDQYAGQGLSGIGFMKRINILSILTELWKYDDDAIKDILKRKDMYEYKIKVCWAPG